MASDKKRRKAAKHSPKSQQPRTGPFAHPDGDRRHRGGMTYEQGKAHKDLLRLIGAPPPSEDAEEQPL